MPLNRALHHAARAVGIAVTRAVKHFRYHLRPMFIQLLSEDPRYYFAVILVVVISICLHELGHGFAAMALGDRTPEETGHITLNPLVHMGPTSLVLLAVTGIAWGLMPVDRSRLRGRYADALVAVAGPAVNLVLAAVALTALGLWLRFGTVDVQGNQMVANGVLLLKVAGIYNLLLLLLNLIPVPPLDGSRIVANFSSGYRRLFSSPTMQGFSFALMLGSMMGIGRLAAPWVVARATDYVFWVAGI